MTELYLEHMDSGDALRHERMTDMVALDYRPEYVDHRVVPSSDGEKAYLVSRVTALREPFDPVTTDVSADRVTLYLCGCDHHYYRKSAGVENGDKSPAEVGKDKHVLSAFRTENAKNDDSQVTL